MNRSNWYFIAGWVGCLIAGAIPLFLPGAGVVSAISALFAFWCGTKAAPLLGKGDTIHVELTSTPLPREPEPRTNTDDLAGLIVKTPVGQFVGTPAKTDAKYVIVRQALDVERTQPDSTEKQTEAKP